jgi:predicted phosphodiesterase
MRVFALSDIHINFDANREWAGNLSSSDYTDDVLILGGDVSDSLAQLEWCLKTFSRRFAKVLFVPGNHDLWVLHEKDRKTSIDKFHQVCRVMESCEVSMSPFHRDTLSIVPLLGWYDYSFGEPTRDLLDTWMDYHACSWPEDFSVNEITEYFLAMNQSALNVKNEMVISFSHFVPRIDLMPVWITSKNRMLYPVLGSSKLESQIRRLNSRIHVYGHSHVNRNVTIDGVCYINNAFGYPHEIHITAKRLMCIYESSDKKAGVAV